MNAVRSKRKGVSYRLLIMSVIMGILICFIGSAPVYAAEPTVTRTLPASVTRVRPSMSALVSVRHQMTPMDWACVMWCPADGPSQLPKPIVHQMRMLAMANSGAAEITWLG